MRSGVGLLEGEVAIVTGATSGIGRATALMAIERGARVVAAGRDQIALDTLRRSSDEPRVVTATADAADPVAVRGVADTALATFGRIDTWAHVAGIAEYARFEDITRIAGKMFDLRRAPHNSNSIPSKASSQPFAWTIRRSGLSGSSTGFVLLIWMRIRLVVRSDESMRTLPS